ncbi:hypothetical protein BKA83DRAFT_4128937 [Pisolithus microcarpus]|nr:hypothetical protein BKA83DRAFT_4128937 [Pisolithus microcarpus]
MSPSIFPAKRTLCGYNVVVLYIFGKSWRNAIVKKTAVGVYTQSSAKDGTLASCSRFPWTRMVTESDELAGIRCIDTGRTGEEGWDESSSVRCIKTGGAGVEGWDEMAGGYSSQDGNPDAAVLDGYNATPGCQMLVRRTCTEGTYQLYHMARIRGGWDSYVTRHNSASASLHTIPRGGMNKESVWESEKWGGLKDEGGIFMVICTIDHGIYTKTTFEGSEPSNVKCQGRRAHDTKDERTKHSLNMWVGSDGADTKRLICDSPQLHLAYDKTEGCAKGAYRLNDEGAIFTFVQTVDDWIHTKTISKGSEPLEGCQVS